MNKFRLVLATAVSFVLFIGMFLYSLPVSAEDVPYGEVHPIWYSFLLPPIVWLIITFGSIKNSNPNKIYGGKDWDRNKVDPEKPQG